MTGAVANSATRADPASLPSRIVGGRAGGPADDSALLPLSRAAPRPALDATCSGESIQSETGVTPRPATRGLRGCSGDSDGAPFPATRGVCGGAASPATSFEAPIDCTFEAAGGGGRMLDMLPAVRTRRARPGTRPPATLLLGRGIPDTLAVAAGHPAVREVATEDNGIADTPATRDCPPLSGSGGAPPALARTGSTAAARPPATRVEMEDDDDCGK